VTAVVRERRGGGPYDEDDLAPDRPDTTARVDFGALRLPVPDGVTAEVEPGGEGKLQAVHLTFPTGRLSVSVLAAPTTDRLWPELAQEIYDALRAGGARVRWFDGRWGREVRARTGDAFSVFVGVDGPRWMVYGVATGPPEGVRTLDRELRRVLSGAVVVRGAAPYPVRTVLPLTLPAELAARQEERRRRQAAAEEALQAQARASEAAAGGAAAGGAAAGGTASGGAASGGAASGGAAAGRATGVPRRPAEVRRADVPVTASGSAQPREGARPTPGASRRPTGASAADPRSTPVTTTPHGVGSVPVERTAPVPVDRPTQEIPAVSGPGASVGTPRGGPYGRAVPGDRARPAIPRDHARPGAAGAAAEPPTHELPVVAPLPDPTVPHPPDVDPDGFGWAREDQAERHRGADAPAMALLLGDPMALFEASAPGRHRRHG